MKQRLLFSLMFLFTYSIWAQGPPPPCGLSPSYACDQNGDGFEEFNLVALYPFSFCASTLDPNDYYPTTYHLTEEDADNDVNPIADPTSYISNVYFQIIYFRAEKITPDGSHNVLTNFDYLYVLPPPTANIPMPLIVCNSNIPGIGTFDLTDKKLEILSGQLNYGLNFYVTLADAENLLNAIPLVGYTNIIAYQQTIFASVYTYYNGECIEIVELDLLVQGQCQDLAVYLNGSYFHPRPGFSYSNHLFIKNEGSQAITSGTVEFTLDVDLEFIGVPNPGSGNSITMTLNSFTLDFVNLGIGEFLSISIPFYCPVSTIIGTQIINSASYITNSEDAYAFNDTSFVIDTVIGSFDPNDIIESHGPTILYDDFTSDDYLYYTVRFQNIGTAEAIDISIENTLNAKLDKSTFQIINSSHTNSVNRIGDQLTWIFSGINLPSESMDEPNSHGFVYYKIKPTTGYSVGDIIPNAAEIYFDFNPAVLTNTFETEFVATLSVTDFNLIQLQIYPNPASDTVNINFSVPLLENVSIIVYDIQGKLVLSKNNFDTNIPIQIDVSNLNSGMYFVMLKNRQQLATKKLIVE